MRYLVEYASGRKFKADGVLVVRPSPVNGSRLLLPCIDSEPNKTLVLDPRAIIKDVHGQVVFTGCSTAQLEADEKDLAWLP